MASQATSIDVEHHSLSRLEELPRELVWMIFDYTHDSVHILHEVREPLVRPDIYHIFRLRQQCKC